MPLPSTMTAIEMTAPGDPEVLHAVEAAVPLPAPGEILIRVAAAGLNGADLGQRRGGYQPPPGAHPGLGLEVSGEVAAVGNAAGGWQPGDRVVALTNGGGYAEYAVVPHGQVLPLPAGWSLVDGAALPETHFTVMQTLVMRAGLTAGMHVLVHGGASGIGGAAIVICNILGASPIAVVSSPAKAAYARAMGAAAIIDRTTEAIADRTLEITGGRGADRVLDLAGGAATEASIAASAAGGQIVVIATPAGKSADISLARLMGRDLTLHGSRLRPRSAASKSAIAGKLWADIWPALARPETPRPRITRFALDDAAGAHAAMEAPTHFGKILLVTRFGQTSEKVA